MPSDVRALTARVGHMDDARASLERALAALNAHYEQRAIPHVEAALAALRRAEGLRLAAGLPSERPQSDD